MKELISLFYYTKNPKTEIELKINELTDLCIKKFNKDFEKYKKSAERLCMQDAKISKNVKVVK